MAGPTVQELRELRTARYNTPAEMPAIILPSQVSMAAETPTSTLPSQVSMAAEAPITTLPSQVSMAAETWEASRSDPKSPIPKRVVGSVPEKVHFTRSRKPDQPPASHAVSEHTHDLRSVSDNKHYTRSHRTDETSTLRAATTPTNTLRNSRRGTIKSDSKSPVLKRPRPPGTEQTHRKKPNLSILSSPTTPDDAAALDDDTTLEDDNAAHKATSLLISNLVANSLLVNQEPTRQSVDRESDIESLSEDDSERDAHPCIFTDIERVMAFCRGYSKIQRPIPSQRYTAAQYSNVTRTTFGLSCIIRGVPWYRDNVSKVLVPFYSEEIDFDSIVGTKHVMQIVFFRCCVVRSWMLRGLVPTKQDNIDLADPADPEWFANMRSFEFRLFDEAYKQVVSWLLFTLTSDPPTSNTERVKFWNAQLSAEDLVAIWCHLAPGVAIKTLAHNPTLHPRWSQWLRIITMWLVDHIYVSKITELKESERQHLGRVLVEDRQEFARCFERERFQTFGSLRSIPSDAPMFQKSRPRRDERKKTSVAEEY